MYQRILLIFILLSHSNVKCEKTVNLKWQKVLIEKEHLSPLRTSKFIKIETSKIVCGSVCSSEEGCTTWCSENGNMCYLSNIIVSPSYIISGSDPLECFTKSRVDIVVGSGITSTPKYDSKSDVNSINDGIFTNLHGPSYSSIFASNAWILFDLRKSAMISEVRFYPHPDKYYCSNIEIRIGSSMVTNGDFSSYSFFGKQDGDCRTFNWNIITADSPISGQYLAFLRKEANILTSILILEVDGVFQ